MDVYIRDRAFPVTRLPAPIYIKFDVSNGIYIYIWALVSTLAPSAMDQNESPLSCLKAASYLASTLAHSASEINKALSVTYKLLFILSKNIVPSRSYRYIRDRAFPVTACHDPLYIQSLM